MANKYYNIVIKEMTPFIEENGFSFVETGVYKNEKKSFKVKFNEEKEMFVLETADIDEEGVIGDYVEIDAWLFDESQNENDAVSVGIDFVEVLRKNLGIKNRPKTSMDIDLPTYEGDKFNVSAFTKKVLDTYPQLKDTYKDYVAKYGSFLYVNFYGEYLVPLMLNTVKENNKKSAKKILDLIEPAFVKGDNDASNAAIACLSAVCVKDHAAQEFVMDILAENASLKNAVVSFSNELKSNKKLRTVLVK